MTDLVKIEQVMEFAYDLNRQSVDDIQDRVNALMRSRTAELRRGEQDVGAVVEQRDPGRDAELMTHGSWLRRRVGVVESDQTRLVDQERQRLRGILDLDTQYLYENAALARGHRGNRVSLAQQHARVLTSDAGRLGGGAGPGVQDQGRGWFDRVLSVVQTFNHYGDLAGLPHIPETAEQLGRFLKERYDVYTGEIREAVQIQALGGWEIQDARKFMTALHEQKAQFPGLAQEISATVAALARNLPRLGDDKLIAAAQDLRRAAFLLGQSGDQLATTVGKLSRVTGRDVASITGALLTIRDFATKGQEQPAADVAVQTLYSAFEDLTVEGQKYGITIEESVYLIGKFRHQLDRAVLSVQDLIHFATSMRSLDPDKRLFIGHEIAARLRDNPKFRVLANELNHLVKAHDELGLDRMIEALASGAKDIGRQEFGIPEDRWDEMEREFYPASRAIVEAKAAEFSGGDELRQRYVADQLAEQLLGMSPGMTIDQRYAFMAFSVQGAKLRKQQDDEDRKRIDALMLEQENVFQRAEQWVNVKLLLLTGEIDSYVRQHRDMFSAQGLKNQMATLKAKATGIKDNVEWAVTPGPKGRARGVVPVSAGGEDTGGEAGEPGWGPPIAGPVRVRPGGEFGHRTPPTEGASSEHMALDIRGAVGTPVLAAGPGVVEFAGRRGGYGNTIEILHHDGSRTKYHHLSKIDVKTGDHVQGGEKIGEIGQTGTATGPHLDFQYENPDRRKVNPRDVPKLGIGHGSATPEARGRAGTKGKPQSSFTIDVKVRSAQDDAISRTMMMSGLDGLERLGDVKVRHG
jgi:murein DD-endopeptidase MepM/ murein hydrolase activator NlpD